MTVGRFSVEIPRKSNPSVVVAGPRDGRHRFCPSSYDAPFGQPLTGASAILIYVIVGPSARGVRSMRRILLWANSYIGQSAGDSSSRTDARSPQSYATYKSTIDGICGTRRALLKSRLEKISACYNDAQVHGHQSHIKEYKCAPLLRERRPSSL